MNTHETAFYSPASPCRSEPLHLRISAIKRKGRHSGENDGLLQCCAGHIHLNEECLFQQGGLARRFTVSDRQELQVLGLARHHAGTADDHESMIPDR